MSNNLSTTIRDLYPQLSDAELAEAEGNIQRFLAVVIRITERLEKDGCFTAGHDLTASENRANVPDERSNPLISNN